MKKVRKNIWGIVSEGDYKGARYIIYLDKENAERDGKTINLIMEIYCGNEKIYQEKYKLITFEKDDWETSTEVRLSYIILGKLEHYKKNITEFFKKELNSAVENYTAEKIEK